MITTHTYRIQIKNKSYLNNMEWSTIDDDDDGGGGGGGYKLFNQVNQLANESVNTIVDLKRVPSSIVELRKLLEQILEDPDCIMMYTMSNVARFTVLNAIAKLFKTVYNDQYKKSSALLLKRFVDLDYDDESECFICPEVISTYGAVFSSMSDVFNDRALDESFYAEESTPVTERSRQTTLTLLAYYFKAIHLKQLYQLGFRHRYFQFLIVNFLNSYSILNVIDAMTSNLIDRPDFLYNPTDSEQLDSDQFYLNMVDSVYIISLKSCKLLFKRHKLAPLGLKKILRIHENVGMYLSRVKPTSSLPRINMKLWRTLSSKMVRLFVVKLKKEVDSFADYATIAFDFKNLFYCLRVIHIHYNNMDKLHAKLETDNLFRLVRRILSALGERLSVNFLEPEAENVQNECFNLISLFCKKIGKLFVKANMNTFLDVWEDHLFSYCPAAFQALESVMKLNLKKSVEFVRPLINHLINQINIEDCKRQLVMMADCAASFFKFYCINYAKALRFNPELIELINSLKYIMKSVTFLGCKYLEAYLSFNHKLLEEISDRRLKTKPWSLLFGDLPQVFAYLIYDEYEYQIRPSVYYQCGPIVKLMVQHFNKAPDQHSDYMPLLRDMIERIKFELQTDRGLSNKLRLLTSLDSILAPSPISKI